MIRLSRIQRFEDGRALRTILEYENLARNFHYAFYSRLEDAVPGPTGITYVIDEFNDFEIPSDL